MREDTKNKFRAIFEDDFFKEHHKPHLVNRCRTEIDRLVESFELINGFIDKFGCEPKLNGSEVNEENYYFILEGLKENEDNMKLLQEYDRHNILSPKREKKLNSIEDICNDEMFKLMCGEGLNIFDMKHVKSKQGKDERQSADYVARKRKCDNFEQYEKLFNECQIEIKEGKRKIIPFKESDRVPGAFFVLNGLLVYLEVIGKTYKGSDGKLDGRIRCIFSNGTESDMLLRSLTKRLYESGYSITGNMDNVGAIFDDSFSKVTTSDKDSGYIYVLKSHSSDIRISEIKNLYKIGFSNMSVEERIKNASTDPTFLMAPVEIVATWKCFNMNPQKFEQIIHKFFGNSCLNIDIFDKNKIRHTPREWFIVPLSMIDYGLELITNGEVIGHRYDKELERIVKD